MQVIIQNQNDFMQVVTQNQNDFMQVVTQNQKDIKNEPWVFSFFLLSK